MWLQSLTCLQGHCTRKKVKKGFIKDGVIDVQTEIYPDIREIVHTCKNKSIVGEKNLVLTVVLEIMLK